MNRYLLLVDNVDVYPAVSGVDIYPIYKSRGKLLRFIRFLHHRSGVLSRYKTSWLSEWKDLINSYSDIVIIDSIYDYTPLIYIRKISPNVRIAFCFRNRVDERIAHSTIHRQPMEIRDVFGCELWSYSKEDCKEFNMILYNQFHLIPDEMIKKERPIKYDCYFIGADKNRLSTLLKLKEKLDKIGLISKVEVVADKKKEYNQDESEFIIKPRPYRLVLEKILCSRCVIDIVGATNYGMTYRSLEASVLGKKLITNYAEITSAPFYNSNNIFVLGLDEDSKLRDFVLSPFDNTVSKYLDKYKFSHFCRRIFRLNDN